MRETLDSFLLAVAERERDLAAECDNVGILCTIQRGCAAAGSVEAGKMVVGEVDVPI